MRKAAKPAGLALVCLVLVCLVLAWSLPAPAEEGGQRNDPQVDFKLFGYARVNKPVKWSIRGELGNVVSDVTGAISATQPLSGQTTTAMKMYSMFDWYGGGEVVFTQEGQTEVMASIKCKNYGNWIIFSRTFPVTVHPAGDRQ